MGRALVDRTGKPLSIILRADLGFSRVDRDHDPDVPSEDHRLRDRQLYHAVVHADR